MKYFFFFLPVIIGVALTTQAGVNSQLKVAVNNPWLAAFISFLVGTVFLGLIMLFTKQEYPTLSQLSSISLYKYTGGILGAFIVTAIIFSVQKIGSANVFVLLIGGQLLVALIYDHFGWFGLPRHSFTLVKLLGVILLVTGAWLINKK
jgi:transporter family-2 protein